MASPTLRKRCSVDKELKEDETANVIDHWQEIGQVGNVYGTIRAHMKL
jgi:hypothetical protein